MVKRKTGKRSSRVAGIKDTVVEARFRKIVENTCAQIGAELASDFSTVATANSFMDFLDRGAREVVVRPRKNGQTRRASCLDVAYKHLMTASPNDYQKIVVPYLTSPEARLFLPYLYELRDAGVEIGLKWEQAEKVLRKFLHGQSGPKRVRRIPKGALTRRGVIRKSLKGERNADVASRRAHLRTMMSSGSRPHVVKICQRWDAERIQTPEAWQSKGILTWGEARKKIPNNLHKLISVDVSRIRKRN